MSRNIGKEIADDSGNHTITAAEIEYREKYRKTYEKCWVLDESSCSLEDFLNNSLDQEYDPGYGTQHVFGNIWFSDGTWMERREYDGQEWWEHVECPQMPTAKGLLAKP